MNAEELVTEQVDANEKLVTTKKPIYCCHVTLCSGGCPWYINLFTWPFVLLWNFIRIYLWPCIYLLFRKCFELICCNCCICLNYYSKFYLYNDDQFKRINRSLAVLDADNLDFDNKRFKSTILHELDEKMLINLSSKRIDFEQNGKYCRIEWQRLSDIIVCKQLGKPHLFNNNILPSDVQQGKLGNNWLLSSIASLAEYPNSIKNCFTTYNANSRHCYKIQIYDGRLDKRKWVTIEIDDFIPVFGIYNFENERNNSNINNAVEISPIFSQVNNNAMWVSLLEKAFAKFCGSYSELSGGHPIWAMTAITGDYCSRWEFNDASELEDGIGNSNERLLYWKKYVIEYQIAKSRNPKKDWLLKRCQNDVQYNTSNNPEIDYNHNYMYKIMYNYHNKESIMVASIMKTDDDDQFNNIGKTGLIVGHTYTISKIGEFGLTSESISTNIADLTLFRMRNPWGLTEWHLDYGNDDPRWQQDKYKKIRNEMMKDVNRYHDDDDGTFLMSKNDFFKYFNVIQICHRSTIRDLSLHINEENGSRGIVTGCCIGCTKYWCCDGCKKIYFGQATSPN